jgi:hypothetical protein
LAVTKGYSQQVTPDSLLKSSGEGQVKLDSGNVVAGKALLDSLDSGKKTKFTPKPRTAVLLSIIPGAGQAYNRDYWKMPFVIAAFVGVGYDIQWQTRRYKDYRKAYFSFFDENGVRLSGKATADVVIRQGMFNFSGKTEIKQGQYDQIKRGKDFYRRWRDYGYVFLGASYALSAIEAYVAAHLKSFDISEDLTIKVHPSAVQPGAAGVAPGVRLVFGFK